VNLWFLFRAEMGYQKSRLLMTWLIGCNAALVVVSQLPFASAQRGMLLVLFWTAFMALMGGERLRLREKTDRRDQLLPLSNPQLAVSRYVVPAVCWMVTLLSVLGVLLLWQWQGNGAMHYISFQQVLSIQGILAVLVGLGRIFSDIRSWVDSKVKRQWLWTAWKMTALLSIIPFLTVLNAGELSSGASAAGFLMTFTHSWAGVCVLSGAGLLMLSAGFYLNLHKVNRSNP